MPADDRTGARRTKGTLGEPRYRRRVNMQTPPARAIPGWQLRRFPLGFVSGPAIAVGGACLCLTLLLWSAPFTHDVVWQFWLARQMGAGARLYVDLVEVNPPLWFWMAMAVQRIAELLAIPATSALAALISLWIGVSTLCFARSLAWQAPASPLILLPAAFSAMALLPLADFGQREHLTLIGVIPYVALIAARSGGARIPPGLALLIGALAAPALGLKPYFLVVPAALEIWLLLRLKNAWRPLRPETIMLGGFGAAYIVAVLAFAPEFLTRIVPLVRAAYWILDGSWGALLGNPSQVLWVLVPLVFLRLSRAGDFRITPLATAFLLSGACFVLVYFAQRKGWQYHTIPATGCFILAAAAQVAAAERPLARLRQSPLAAAALLAPLLFAIAWGTYHNPKEARMAAALAGMRPGEHVAVLTEDATLAWPAVDRAGLRWSSRYYALWVVPAFAETARRSGMTPALRALQDEVRAATVDDLRCAAPRRILIDVAPVNIWLRRTAFDLQSFLLDDAAFHRFLSQYRHVGTLQGFDVYERTAMPPAPAPGACPPAA